MMPCKFCELTGRLGLKQVGKTRVDGTRFERWYRCQDCNATMRFSGDHTALHTIKEEWSPPGLQSAGVRATRTGTLLWLLPSPRRSTAGWSPAYVGRIHLPRSSEQRAARDPSRPGSGGRPLFIPADDIRPATPPPRRP
jgi:hypothetical protein